MLDTLDDDLADRVFDGRNASENVSYVGTDHRICLASYTMRKDLSEAILLYSKGLQGTGKLTSDDARIIESPGRIVD